MKKGEQSNTNQTCMYKPNKRNPTTKTNHKVMHVKQSNITTNKKEDKPINKGRNQQLPHNFSQNNTQ